MALHAIPVERQPSQLTIRGPEGGAPTFTVKVTIRLADDASTYFHARRDITHHVQFPSQTLQYGQAAFTVKVALGKRAHIH